MTPRFPNPSQATRQIVCAGLASLALLAGVAVAGDAVRDDVAEVCFPKSSWSSATADHPRPCYRIGRPQEDGSGSLEIRTGGHRWQCYIPNAAEEGARFSIRCNR